MKRFYKTVATRPLDGGFTVMLDQRPMRTPAKAALLLPNLALAEAIAAEWRGQGETIKPLEMGLTRLANTGIDRVSADRARILEDLVAYGGSDLLCYRADTPADLASRQARIWQPWLDWAAERFGAPLTVRVGIVHVAQDPVSLQALRIALARASDLELAGVGAAAQPLGSLVLGLALWHGAIESDAAVDAALLDEIYQANRWGEDQETVRRHQGLRRDVGDAARFLTLLRDAG